MFIFSLHYASAACIVQTKILPTELWSWTQGYWEPVGFTGKILCWLQHSGYRAAAWLIIWSTSVKFVHYFSDSLSNLIFLRYPASEFLDLKHSINYLLWPFFKKSSSAGLTNNSLEKLQAHRVTLQCWVWNAQKRELSKKSCYVSEEWYFKHN